MWWLRRLFSAPRGRQADSSLWLHVQCDRCGEVIDVRVDRRYDVASNLLDPGEEGPAYTMHKDIVGNRCFRRIGVTLGFDRRMNVVEKVITGGRLRSEPASGAEGDPRPLDCD